MSEISHKFHYEAEKYLGCQREDSSCEFKNNCDGPIKYSAKKTNKKIDFIYSNTN